MVQGQTTRLLALPSVPSYWFRPLEFLSGFARSALPITPAFPLCPVYRHAGLSQYTFLWLFPIYLRPGFARILSFEALKMVTIFLPSGSAQCAILLAPPTLVSGLSQYTFLGLLRINFRPGFAQ